MAAADDGIRSVILASSAMINDVKEKQAFCAGADLKKHSQSDRTHAQKRDYIMHGQNACAAFYEFCKPTVAVVNGPDKGAGVEMALNCDFIYTAEDATLAFTETGLATFVGGGVTLNLPRIIGLTKAKELIYSGRVINDREALYMGLALRCYPIADLLPRALDFAGLLAEKAPVSMAHAKKRLQQPQSLDYHSVLLLEADAVFACMDTEDWHEGVRSFNEGRKPIFKGN